MNHKLLLLAGTHVANPETRLPFVSIKHSWQTARMFPVSTYGPDLRL